MAYRSFRDLEIWKKAKDIAINVYRLTTFVSFTKDFPLRDQTRKSAISVVSNIAEGYERSSDKEFIQYLHIARGSLSELVTQLEIAQAIGYINENEFCEIEEKRKELGAMITGLINYRKRKLP